MAKLAPSKYVKPAPAERENPFIDGVKVYTDQGIDTPFDVEFTAEDYKAEKLLIQKAANVHGFTAREVSTTYTDETPAKSAVKSTFVVRPARKSRDNDDASADAAEGDEG